MSVFYRSGWNLNLRHAIQGNYPPPNITDAPIGLLLGRAAVSSRERKESYYERYQLGGAV
jgi:hypothetical protein